MKITVIAPLNIPNDTKSGGRIHYICKCLAEMGYNVNIILTNPTEAFSINQPVIVDNVCYSFPLGKSKFQLHLHKRIIDIVLIQFSILTKILFNFGKNDVIILFPAFDFRMFIPILAKITKTKVILEINEYPLVHKADSFINRIKQKIILNFTFPFYDGFIVISEELKNLVIKYKSDKSLIVKIPVISLTPIHRKDLKSPLDCPYIFHAGSLFEKKDGILGIIKAFNIATSKLDKEIRLVFTGYLSNSPDKILLSDVIKRSNNQEKIIFLGHLSTEELDRYMRFASLAIVNKNDNLQNKYCFATKLAEYLSYSIAVITTKIGEVQYYLTDNLNVFFVPPGDIEALADKIIYSFSHTDEITHIAEHGNKVFIDEFSIENCSKSLAQYFKKVAYYKH